MNQDTEERGAIKHLLCKHLLKAANQQWPGSTFSHHLTDCHSHQTVASWLSHTRSLCIDEQLPSLHT